MPAVFDPVMRPHAQAFYGAQAMGVLDKTHDATYDAIHRDGRKLRSEEEIKAVFMAAGVAPEVFDKHFRSFGVDAKVRRAEAMTERYGVMATPTLIVNGRYLITNQLAGGFDKMMNVVEVLVEAERERMGLGKPAG